MHIPAHNLKVVGSNPTPATTEAPENIDVFRGVFISGQADSAVWQTIGKQFDSHLSCQETPHDAPELISGRSMGFMNDGTGVGRKERAPEAA